MNKISLTKVYLPEKASFLDPEIPGKHHSCWYFSLFSDLSQFADRFSIVISTLIQFVIVSNNAQSNNHTTFMVYIHLKMKESLFEMVYF